MGNENESPMSFEKLPEGPYRFLVDAAEGYSTLYIESVFNNDPTARPHRALADSVGLKDPHGGICMKIGNNVIYRTRSTTVPAATPDEFNQALRSGNIVIM
ncbi:hypothetical protein JW887_00515 [Candidatus Dojkabacteria bacterium]|nr:hypothetical protein [Candidatus Dojkabacteria bacterium]